MLIYERSQDQALKILHNLSHLFLQILQNLHLRLHYHRLTEISPRCAAILLTTTPWEPDNFF